MVSLQDVQLQNHLTLKELGKAVNSLWINPNGDYEITAHESKRIADQTEGYREFQKVVRCSTGLASAHFSKIGRAHV